MSVKSVTFASVACVQLFDARTPRSASQSHLYEQMVGEKLALTDAAEPKHVPMAGLLPLKSALKAPASQAPRERPVFFFAR